MVVRGRGLGLEIVLSEDDLTASLDALDARFAEQRDFYRGSGATVLFGSAVPTDEQFARLRGILGVRGITLRALQGGADVERRAREENVEFSVATQERLSPAARSLVADFAGARNDIAGRRKRGESSVRRSSTGEAPQLRLAEAVTTLYHAGTLRGGQALHHVGNLVVVGDVNPGAEVVATGDILVFGRLCGVAHAGAQGDEAARVYAIALRPVQLRIASRIAADDDRAARGAQEPEVAFVREAHIVIVPFHRMEVPN